VLANSGTLMGQMPSLQGLSMRTEIGFAIAA
jgi:hypothetical protein